VIVSMKRAPGVTDWPEVVNTTHLATCKGSPVVVPAKRKNEAGTIRCTFEATLQQAEMMMQAAEAALAQAAAQTRTIIPLVPDVDVTAHANNALAAAPANALVEAGPAASNSTNTTEVPAPDAEATTTELVSPEALAPEANTTADVEPSPAPAAAVDANTTEVAAPVPAPIAAPEAKRIEVIAPAPVAPEANTTTVAEPSAVPVAAVDANTTVAILESAPAAAVDANATAAAPGVINSTVAVGEAPVTATPAAPAVILEAAPAAPVFNGDLSKLQHFLLPTIDAPAAPSPALETVQAAAPVLNATAINATVVTTVNATAASSVNATLAPANVTAPLEALNVTAAPSGIVSVASIEEAVEAFAADAESAVAVEAAAAEAAPLESAAAAAEKGAALVETAASVQAAALVPDVSVAVQAQPLAAPGVASPPPAFSAPYTAMFDVPEKACLAVNQALSGPLAKYILPSSSLFAAGLRTVCGPSATHTYDAKLGGFDSSACGTNTVSTGPTLPGGSATINVNVVGCNRARLARPDITINKLQAVRVYNYSWTAETTVTPVGKALAADGSLMLPATGTAAAKFVTSLVKSDEPEEPDYHLVVSLGECSLQGVEARGGASLWRSCVLTRPPTNQTDIPTNATNPHLPTSQHPPPPTNHPTGRGRRQHRLACARRPLSGAPGHHQPRRRRQVRGRQVPRRHGAQLQVRLQHPLASRRQGHHPGAAQGAHLQGV